MDYKLFFLYSLIFYLFYKTIDGIYQYGMFGYLQKKSDKRRQRNDNLLNFVQQNY
jgi:hypothetical protein